MAGMCYTSDKNCCLGLLIRLFNNFIPNFIAFDIVIFILFLNLKDNSGLAKKYFIILFYCTKTYSHDQIKHTVMNVHMVLTIICYNGFAVIKS